MRSRSTLAALVTGWLALLLHAGCSLPGREPQILLLVTVDTLRADRLGCYGGELDITPRIDALADESLVFEHAYAPTSFTLPSVSSLLTGRYPEEVGILSNRSALAPEIPTLASAFREHGWRTAAVVSNLVLRANSGLDTGFERYDDLLPDAEETRGWPERVATGTTDAALAALEELRPSGDPIFLWVHYQDPHGPYTPPGHMRQLFLPAERQRPGGRDRLDVARSRGEVGKLPDYQYIPNRKEVAFYRAGYNGEVHYLDREFGRLLDELAARDLWESTSVVFTADHGESLGEWNYWFAHGERIDEPLIRVPLLIRLPGVPAARRNDVVSLVDLAPTLEQRFLGSDVPGDSSGRNILEATAPDVDSVPYVATLGGTQPERFAIIDRGYWYVVSQGSDGRREALYRLGHEGRDLSRTDPQILEEMRASLVKRRAELRRDVPEHRQRLSDAEARNLEAIGYAGDGSDNGEP